jgi:hypothetical protein
MPGDDISLRWQASFGCGVNAAIGPSDHDPKCQPPLCAFSAGVAVVNATAATNQILRISTPPKLYITT